jgi:hypothetical protein
LLEISRSIEALRFDRWAHQVTTSHDLLDGGRLSTVTPDGQASGGNSPPASSAAASTTSAPPNSGQQSPPPPPPHGEHRDEVRITLAEALHELARPLTRLGNALVERAGLRLALIGVALVIAAFELGAGSALSVPLLVVGLVMLVVGALGSRLRGRFAVDFGPGGAVIEARAEIAPPRRTAPVTSPPTKPRITLVTPTASDQSGPDDVIEGHGETIEMDVAQLKRLLAAERADTAGG